MTDPAAADDPARPAPGAPLTNAEPWPGLAALVVKRGLMLGGLPEPVRATALALVWRGLPAGPVDERAINHALRARLDGPAACLDTDHVELRRWLVDGGWLARDGFGRAYRAVPAPALPAAWRPLGAALAAVDLDAWVAGQVSARDAARERRRAAWRSTHGEPAAPGR